MLLRRSGEGEVGRVGYLLEVEALFLVRREVARVREGEVAEVEVVQWVEGEVLRGQEAELSAVH